MTSSAPKTEVVYAWDTISAAMSDGLEDLIAIHHDEISVPGEPPLELNWPKYLMLERLGAYRSVSARLDGRLVGYRSFFIDEPMHYRATQWAINDALYVEPEHRKSRIGRDLIVISDRLLKAAGISMVLQADRKAHKLAAPKGRATLGDLLRLIGYSPFETVHVRKL